MSDEIIASSGAKDSTGGESKDKKQPDASGEGSYPKDFVDKLKREKENLAKGKTALEQELEALKKEKQSREEADLQAQNKFKELYEAQKARAESIEKELSSTRETIVEGKKNTAIRTELVKLGFDETHIESAFKLLDKKMVAYDQSTGTVVGADEAAKAFHQNYGSLGFFKKQTPGANHQAPGGQPGKIDLSKISTSEKLRMLAQMKK